MAKSRKRAQALMQKRAAKRARMAKSEKDKSQSRYARKQRGELQPEYSGHGQRPLCSLCYLRMCACSERAKERAAELEVELRVEGSAWLRGAA